MNLIIGKPGDGPVTGVAFGGAQFQTLYATAGGKVCRRRTQRTGEALIL